MSSHEFGWMGQMVDELAPAAKPMLILGGVADVTMFGGEATGSLFGAAEAGAEALSGSWSEWQGW